VPRMSHWEKMRAGTAYKQYDPASGRGSVDDWRRTAEALLREIGLDQVNIEGDDGAPLRILERAYNPQSRTELMADFRAAAKRTHPDFGGTNEAFREVVKVYASWKRRRGW
jgi:hypothetical protein